MELSSDLVCLFSKQLLAGFQLGREPFADADTGIWKGAIQQHTKQETDAQIAQQGIQLGLEGVSQAAGRRLQADSCTWTLRRTLPCAASQLAHVTHRH